METRKERSKINVLYCSVLYSKVTLIAAPQITTEQGTRCEAQREDQDQDLHLQDTSLQHSKRSRPPTRQMKSSKHFLLLLTVLAMPLLTTFASTSNHNIGEPNKPLVQIFTGAYFTPMPETLPYISSIPIIYNIPFNTQQNLPKNEPSLNFCPKNLNNSQRIARYRPFHITNHHTSTNGSRTPPIHPKTTTR
ncbi:hypothetical protein J6590_098583 [Homalodisca vitripennis]|nr:hypothetical protein J6590_098583 [Homalodisca vitripennis]